MRFIEIKLPKNVPIPPSKMTTTTKTDKPRLRIFRSNASTLDKSIVVNKKANTSINTTSDIYGQIMDKNHKLMSPIITR